MGSVSPFSALNTAFSGLQAAQAALNITSKNIASVGVDGYSRQRVHQEAQPGATTLGGRAPISGVTVASYERIRDTLLDRRLYDQLPRSGDADARSSMMGQVELAFAEPTEYGLQHVMDRFWSAWQSASSSPTSEPARQALIDRAGSMTETFNQINSQLDTVIGQITDEQTQRGVEITQMAADIASLNQDIQLTRSYGGSASDLEDKRDLIIGKLAEYGNVSVEHLESGMVNVSFGAGPLVTGTAAAAAGQIQTDINTVSSGRMFALEDMRATVIPSLTAKLDSIAMAIRDQVNTAHQTGFDLDGNPGGVVFTGSDALNFSLDATWASSPRKVAMSNSSTAPGNNSIAINISSLDSLAGTVSGTASIRGAYGSLVSSVGSLVQQARSSQAVQGVISDSIRNKVDGVSGVSMDEEMSNLIRYQQSYSAAARAVTAVDQMMDVLINRTGKVGM